MFLYAGMTLMFTIECVVGFLGGGGAGASAVEEARLIVEKAEREEDRKKAEKEWRRRQKAAAKKNTVKINNSNNAGDHANVQFTHLDGKALPAKKVYKRPTNVPFVPAVCSNPLHEDGKPKTKELFRKVVLPGQSKAVSLGTSAVPS